MNDNSLSMTNKSAAYLEVFALYTKVKDNGIHGLTRRWLENERSGLENDLSTSQLKEIITKSFELDQFVQASQSLLKLCDFHLNQEFRIKLSKPSESDLSVLGNPQSVSGYFESVDRRIQHLKEEGEFVRKHMAETYRTKSPMELAEMLRDDYFIDMYKVDLRKIDLLIGEIKYNLVELNADTEMTNQCDQVLNWMSGVEHAVGHKIGSPNHPYEDNWERHARGCASALREGLVLLAGCPSGLGH